MTAAEVNEIVHPSHISGYPKVWNLGHPQVRDIFLDDVIVQEKIDGSQFSFGVVYGNIRCRSKNQGIVLDAAGMFSEAVATVIERAEKLNPGYIYRGEFLKKPRHNVLAYGRVPFGNVILFDVQTGIESYLGPEELYAEAQRIGLECVPMLYRGKIGAANDLRNLLTVTSCLGGPPVEGVVAKNYARFNAHDGHVLLGKFVSEAFKEVHAGAWRAANPTKGDIVDQIVTDLRTPARWQKALQTLRDAGALEGSPRDIGPLIKAVQLDIEDEEGETIKAALYAWAIRDIRRRVVGGVAEWYKQLLLDAQFQDPKDDMQYGGGTCDEHDIGGEG